jgi:membrane protease YdiL (CAAX protease family)
MAHAYQGLAGVLITGVIGLVLGVVFLLGRRNLVAGIVLHGLLDTISLTLLFLGLAPPAAGVG